MDKYKFFSVPFGLLAGLIIFLGLVGCQDIFLLKQWGTIKNMYPSGGTTTTTPTLTWDAVDGADVYEVLIWASSDTLISDKFSFKNEYSPQGLTSNTTYSWKVRALDFQPGSATATDAISRAGAWSGTSTFTVSQALSVTLKFASIIQVPTEVGNVPIGTVTTALSYLTDYKLTITKADDSAVDLDISIDANTNYVTISSVETVSDSGFYTVTATGLDSYADTVEVKATFELSVTTLNLDLVLVMGGDFDMGSPVGETDRNDDEGPQHLVTVSNFYMSEKEITQREWHAVMGGNPSYFTSDDLPVETVSWFEAVEYCNALSLKDELSPVYTIIGTNVTARFDANGYRLPTEAEWEYAARGGVYAGAYNIYSGSDTADDVGWYTGNSFDSGSSQRKTQIVGGKEKNELELYDMSGNVWEWCWDRYGNDYYSVSPQQDPTGPASGSNRVRRGGAWNTESRYLRSASRDYGMPHIKDYATGFRLVRNMLSIPSN